MATRTTTINGTLYNASVPADSEDSLSSFFRAIDDDPAQINEPDVVNRPRRITRRPPPPTPTDIFNRIQNQISELSFEQQIAKIDEKIKELTDLKTGYRNAINAFSQQIIAYTARIATASSVVQKTALLQAKISFEMSKASLERATQNIDEVISRLRKRKEELRKGIVSADNPLDDVNLPEISEILTEARGSTEETIDTLKDALKILQGTLSRELSQLAILEKNRSSRNRLEFLRQRNEFYSRIRELREKISVLRSRLEALENTALPVNAGIETNINNVESKEDTSAVEEINFINLGITVAANSPERTLLEAAASAVDPPVTPKPTIENILRDEVDDEDQPDIIVQPPLQPDNRPTRIFEQPFDPNAEVQDQLHKLDDGEKPDILGILSENIQNGYPKRSVLFVKKLQSERYIHETYYVYRKNMLMDDDYVLLKTIPADEAKFSLQDLRKKYGNQRASKYYKVMNDLGTTNFDASFICVDTELRPNTTFSYRVACSFIRKDVSVTVATTTQSVTPVGSASEIERAVEITDSSRTQGADGAEVLGGVQERALTITGTLNTAESFPIQPAQRAKPTPG